MPEVTKLSQQLWKKYHTTAEDVPKKFYVTQNDIKKLKSGKIKSIKYLDPQLYTRIKTLTKNHYLVKDDLLSSDDRYARQGSGYDPLIKIKPGLEAAIRKLLQKHEKKTKRSKRSPRGGSTSRSRSRSRSKSRSKSKGKIIRTNKGRKSPRESATQYKVGTRKKGVDGNMWKIKSYSGRKRWVKA
jgi:hypothetical protein